MAGSSELSLIDPASMSATVSEDSTSTNTKTNISTNTSTSTCSDSTTEAGPPYDAWGSLVSAILDDCIFNIISDTVLKAHREEKLARMQSAAIIAQQAKDAAREEASPGGAPLTSITTAGAIIDEHDRIYLHDNPLRTTPEILCPTCRLPRLQRPTMGRGAQAPDPARQYCARQPYILKDGCDIYGKSLALEKLGKKKSANPPGTSNKGGKDKPGVGSRTGSEEGESPPGKGSERPAATAIPSGKCPNCPRYMAFTRIAQHMDRCLGLSGRQSSKNAMTKLQGNTPRDGSRASTPRPSQTASSSLNNNISRASDANNKDGGGGANGKKRRLEKGTDDEAEDHTPAKKKKTGPGLKGARDGKAGGTSKGAVDRGVARVKGEGGKRVPGEEVKKDD